MECRHIRALFSLLFMGLAFCAVPFGRTVVDSETATAQEYTKTEYRIPMRDGVRLFTAVYSPKNSSKPLPILMLRTPYGIHPYGEDKFPTYLGPSQYFLEKGFIFVYQVVQYCKGKAGRTSTLAAGIATMCPILFLMIIPSLLSGFFGGQFPLPVLLAIGLVAIRYAGPKKPITPWDEESNMQIDSP